VPRRARLWDGDEAAAEAAASVVEDLADVDAVRDELGTGASMSSTVRTRPAIEPGSTEVTPLLPMRIEAFDPGGVRCTAR
jgi:hypothetical protein